MVAFVGAVICIIAAVHTGSPASAPQQPAGVNQSLPRDSGVLRAFTEDTAARAGPLGALHGSDAPDRFAEAPTFFHVPNSPDSHGRRQVSRLICTPVPVGECDPKNVQQQAEEPSLYAGEDWGDLRATAKDLRQTLLQQKDQISTDQRTIRELSGKLAECESGVEGRSGPLGSLGSRSSTAAQRLSKRAVDELEQVIVQLKERIEKLESDNEPLSIPHNQTGGAAATGSREAGSGGDAPLGRGGPMPSHPLPMPGAHTGAVPGHAAWQRIDDLEGQLQRRLELLKKERKALRLESQRHKEDIDQGINSLHHRIAGLEEGLSETSYPDQDYKLSLPARTNYMYAVLRQAVPELRAFTACLWLRPTGFGLGTPFSYSVAEQPNELVFIQGRHTPVELLINDKVAQLPLNVSRGSWHHICVTWSQRGGVWQAFQGGRRTGQGQGLAAWHNVRPGGVLVLGQEQDTLGGRFDSAQALVGEMSQWNLWERVLTSKEVSSLASCSRHIPKPLGAVATWADRNVEVFGGASKVPGGPCTAKSTRADTPQ
ncbi:hypothetical protein DPEC_G00275160 [Dallia pectoralis]|uniref:Uncharacterized protein n=1 Tax=Dallia pectoralis TaxID=75939 RepID=A0ACC2FL94_DALPE|nr:hypothetical protein DPEC_G00275160 [Dallia pectoralis]